jgi:hypothetical protein
LSPEIGRQITKHRDATLHGGPIGYVVEPVFKMPWTLWAFGVGQECKTIMTQAS